MATPPADQPEPTKYFLSTLPATISRRALVNATKLRWRIERDYQDLKQELGLGHHEGRGWRAFITTPPCVSPPTGSCSANGEHLPPQASAAPFSSRRLPFPTVIDPADPPIRPERHVPNSITSVRVAVARAIARTMPRCPCCQRHTHRLKL